MKLVAVSQRVDCYPDRAEVRDAIDQRLVAYIAAGGGLSVPVSNAMSDGGLAAWLEAVQPGAVVLSGGNDIGQHPQRDHTEQRLLSYASTHGLPVLGICRGMQMMGVWVGGKIRPVVGHIRTRHQFDGEISGDGNSYHNHVLSECPVGYKVLARSEDGEIEAIRHATLPWEGWMWHPEREVPFSTRDIERLRALLGE